MEGCVSVTTHEFIDLVRPGGGLKFDDAIPRPNPVRGCMLNQKTEEGCVSKTTHEFSLDRPTSHTVRGCMLDQETLEGCGSRTTHEFPRALARRVGLLTSSGCMPLLSDDSSSDDGRPMEQKGVMWELRGIFIGMLIIAVIIIFKKTTREKEDAETAVSNSYDSPVERDAVICKVCDAEITWSFHLCGNCNDPLCFRCIQRCD